MPGFGPGSGCKRQHQTGQGPGLNSTGQGRAPYFRPVQASTQPFIFDHKVVKIKACGVWCDGRGPLEYRTGERPHPTSFYPHHQQYHSCLSILILGFFTCRSRHWSEGGALLIDVFNRRGHREYCVAAGTVSTLIHDHKNIAYKHLVFLHCDHGYALGVWEICHFMLSLTSLQMYKSYFRSASCKLFDRTLMAL